MSATITSCKTCPLYAKTAEVKAATGLPYFGLCKGTGRFVNEAAAKALPGSEKCPLGPVATVAAAEGYASGYVGGIEIPDLPTDTTLDVAEARGTDDTDPVTRPTSCRGCTFFVPKAEGAAEFPGTPVARYDTCAKRGMLVMPGTHKSVAAFCSEGVDTDYAAGGVRAAKASDIKLLPLYIASTTTAPDRKDSPMATSAGPTADAAAGITEDALAALLRGDTPKPILPAPDAGDDFLSSLLGLGASLDGIVPDPIVSDADADAAADAAARVKSDGRKALPKRPKTGMVFDAATYDVSAYEPLPAGAMGVVAVRSTSRASDIVFLPRYSDLYFPEAIQADVPAESETAYLDHNDVLFRMAVAYADDSVAALWGDAGVGKTEGVEQIARLTRQPFCRISIKWATQVDDLLGRWTLADGSMEWLEGRFTKAWREAYIVCVDEPNTGKDEVWQALRAPFDGAKTLILDEKDGERIPRHNGCRIYTAMNPSWDARFTGTQPLNDADLDRMQHIVVPYPPQDVEREILMAKAPHLTTEQIDAMLNVARDVRAAVQANTIRISFGVRKMLRWAGAMRYMSPLAAYKQSVSAWMEPGQARLLDDLCDAYFRS